MKLVKGSIALLVALVMCLVTMQVNTKQVHATTLDEADSCLVETIELTYGEEISVDNLTYERNLIYNEELQSFGYVYSIYSTESAEFEGYAILVNLGLFYEVTEIFFNKESPYKNIIGLPVYLTILSYIEYVDEQFYEVESGAAIDEDTVSYLAERGFKYRGGSYSHYNTEYVSYTSKTTDAYRIPGTFPGYYNTNGSNFANTCAVNSGSVIVGYWGRYFSELVPNHTVGKMLGSAYYYYPQTAAVQTVIEDLYYRMGTNVGAPGTTASGCRNGITSYANSKNRSVTYTSVVSNATLDFPSYKSHIQALKPILLFLNTYNLLGDNYIATGNNTDTIMIDYYTGMHVMVGFGYRTIRYYNGSNNFRTDEYLRVYTGFGDMINGYVKLYDSVVIQEGYAVEIY